MSDEQLAHENELTTPTRRTLLRGTAIVGIAGLSGVGLAACGGDEGTTAGGTGSSVAPTSAAPTSPPASEPAGGAGGGGLATTSEIPVGGGKIFEAEKVVVTQPTAGDFKAFTAVCTHMGCTVNAVSAGVISCPCHGSKYSATDGSVTGGPAPRPLAAKTVTVSGEDITVS